MLSSTLIIIKVFILLILSIVKQKLYKIIIFKAHNQQNNKEKIQENLNSDKINNNKETLYYYTITFTVTQKSSANLTKLTKIYFNDIFYT